MTSGLADVSQACINRAIWFYSTFPTGLEGCAVHLGHNAFGVGALVHRRLLLRVALGWATCSSAVVVITTTIFVLILLLACVHPGLGHIRPRLLRREEEKKKKKRGGRRQQTTREMARQQEKWPDHKRVFHSARQTTTLTPFVSS